MSQNNNQENDCLTVLCFKVTALTNEKAKWQGAAEQLSERLKTVAKDAKEHNDKSKELLKAIEADADLACSSKGDSELSSALKSLCENIETLRSHLA